MWQDRELTVRVAYSLFAQRRGAELEDFQNLTQLLPMGFGDSMLRFNGIGESVTWAMYNNDNPTEADKAKFAEVVRWAAERRMTLTIHWSNEKSVGHLLEVFERVNRDVPIARPALVHRASQRRHPGHARADEGARRRLAHAGRDVLQRRDVHSRSGARRRPAGRRRSRPGMRIGVPIGAGTDAHRVMSYNPFAALQWILDGQHDCRHADARAGGDAFARGGLAPLHAG